MGVMWMRSDSVINRHRAISRCQKKNVCMCVCIYVYTCVYTYIHTPASPPPPCCLLGVMVLERQKLQSSPSS